MIIGSWTGGSSTGSYAGSLRGIRNECTNSLQKLQIESIERGTGRNAIIEKID